MKKFLPSAQTSRRLMAAVVVGTALSALGSEARAAQVQPPTDAVTDISKYCQVCWRNARLPIDRWDDCTQQVFARLLERVDVAQWGTLLRDDAASHQGHR